MQILRAHGAECPLLRPRRLRHRRVDELRVLVEAEDRLTAGGAAVAATKIEAVRAIYDGRYTRAEAKARGFHALIAEAELVRTRVHLTGA